jgi:hypothetical protein
MNGAIRARPISRPLASPIAPHTSSGSATATSEPHCAPYAASTPARANTEPTDRSMPPLMITKVIPTAMSTR